MKKVIDNTNLGYLISKEKATFWQKTESLNVVLDDVPTENSNNLVKSGGVHDAIEDVLDALDGTNVETVTVLPTASASTVGKIYYVGPDSNGDYARYRGIESGGSYSFLSLGSTELDLTNYATKDEVDQLEAKVTDFDYTSLLTDGYYANASWTVGGQASDTVESGTNYKHICLRVYAGVPYKITGSVGSIRVYVLTDTTKKITVLGPTSVSFDDTVTPATDGYLYMNAKTANPYSLENLGLLQRVEVIEEYGIPALSDSIRGLDAAGLFESGYYSNGSWAVGGTASDAVTSSDNYRHLRLAVKKDEAIQIIGSVGSVRLFALTDAQKSIKKIGPTNSTSQVMVIPDEDGYLYVNSLTANTHTVNIIGLLHRTSTLDKKLYEKDLSGLVVSGYFPIGNSETITRTTTETSNDWKGLRYPVSAGNVIYIEGMGGETPRLFALTNEAGEIYNRASSYQSGTFFLTVLYDGFLYANFPSSATPVCKIVSSLSKNIEAVEKLWRANSFYLSGKRIACMGDSITYGYDGTAAGHLKSYPYLLEDMGAIVTNLGITSAHWGGDSTNAFWKRLPNIPANSEIIVVMGLTNDWTFPNGVPMGDITASISSPASSIYAALKYTADYLIRNYPHAQLLFITPIKCLNDGVENSLGLKLRDYAKAIIEVGEYYGIPVLDLNARCNINPNMQESRTLYYLNDGIHPNNAGNRKMFSQILSALGDLSSDYEY